MNDSQKIDILATNSFIGQIPEVENSDAENDKIDL
jgi:hypothetical protein